MYNERVSEGYRLVRITNRQILAIFTTGDGYEYGIIFDHVPTKVDIIRAKLFICAELEVELYERE